MRFLLAGLVLTLLPSFASAQCVCTCVRGRSVPACAATSLVQPICQQICTETVEQSLNASPISGGGIATGSIAPGAASAAAAAGLDSSVASALGGR